MTMSSSRLRSVFPVLSRNTDANNNALNRIFIRLKMTSIKDASVCYVGSRITKAMVTELAVHGAANVSSQSYSYFSLWKRSYFLIQGSLRGCAINKGHVGKIPVFSAKRATEIQRGVSHDPPESNDSIF